MLNLPLFASVPISRNFVCTRTCFLCLGKKWGDRGNHLNLGATVKTRRLVKDPRPWTVDKRYVRSSNPRPSWSEFVCAENNAQVRIGKEIYFLDADGVLMPTRRKQTPPDLKYFKASEKEHQ